MIPDFDPSKIDSIGWSKAAIASRFVTPNNVDEVLETAENTSQRALAATLKEKYVDETGTTVAGKPASRGVKRTSMSFSLVEDAAAHVQLALQAAIKQERFEGPERLQMALALEHICVQWARDHAQATTNSGYLEAETPFG